MDASTVVARMTPAPITTTYRVHLHTPRKPSPLNPAAQKASVPSTADERQSRDTSDNAQREGSRRSRTVSPTQKILRRKAAKTLQTNTLRRQVEAYEARALQGLTTKASSTTSKSTMHKKGKGKEPMDSAFKIGITVTSSANQQPSKKKRRRRWGAFWMLFRARPVVTALGNFWPFESKRPQELAWHSEQPSPVAAASDA